MVFKPNTQGVTTALAYAQLSQQAFTKVLVMCIWHVDECVALEDGKRARIHRVR
jgi:hypothetical protein